MHGWEKLTDSEKQIIREGILSGRAPGGPYHIELSPTDNCNYRCFFCNQGFVDRSRSLSLDRLKSLIDELKTAGLKSVRLSGGGEPLMHKEIVPFMDHLMQLELTLDNITTNGYYLSDSVLERALDLQTREIIVSLNECNRDRYAEMVSSRPDRFDRVVENMKELSRLKEQRGLSEPRLVAQFFIWKENYRDVARMIQLGEEVGADLILLRAIFGLDANQRMSENECNQLRNILRTLVQEYQVDRLQVDLAFEDIDLSAVERPPGASPEPVNSHVSSRRDRYCYIGWYSATIRGDGSVYPCCMLQQKPDYPPLGNINEQSFAEIWNGPGFRRLRSELAAVATQRGHVDKPDRLVQITPFCIAQDQCPLLYALCDDEFYRETEKRMEAKRNSLLRKAWGRIAGKRL